MTVMAIFTEIYSFRLNVARDTNVVQEKLLYGTIFHLIFMGNRLSSQPKCMFVRLGIWAN